MGAPRAGPCLGWISILYEPPPPSVMCVGAVSVAESLLVIVDLFCFMVKNHQLQSQQDVYATTVVAES